MRFILQCLDDTQSHHEGSTMYRSADLAGQVRTLDELNPTEREIVLTYMLDQLRAYQHQVSSAYTAFDPPEQDKTGPWARMKRYADARCCRSISSMRSVERTRDSKILVHETAHVSSFASELAADR